MKKYLLIFIIILSIAKLIAPLRIGGISGDDCLVLLKAFNLIDKKNFFEATTLSGSTGYNYFVLENYFWAQLASLFSFRLFPLYLLYSFLSLVPIFLMAYQLKHAAYKNTFLIFALTSPLLFLFSTQLFPGWIILLFCGNLIFATLNQSTKNNNTLFNIIAGGIFGYLVLRVPINIVYPLAIFILMLQQNHIKNLISFCLGLAFGGYFTYLIFYKYLFDSFPMISVFASHKLNWLNLILKPFCFIGIPPVGWTVNIDSPYLQLETLLSRISVGFWLILAIFFLLIFFKSKKTKKNNQYILGIMNLWILVIIFSFVSKTDSWFHVFLPLWWLPFVAIGWAMQHITKKTLNILISSILLVNFSCLIVQYGPRIFYGTTTESAFSSNGKGPSWWMQQSVSDQIADIAKKEISAGSLEPIAVQVDQIYYLMYSLPRIFQMQNPELEKKVKWVPSSCDGWNFQVTRDFEQPHYLRLAYAPDAWLFPQHKKRKPILVFAEQSPVGPSLVSFKISGQLDGSTVLVDASGKTYKCFWESLSDDLNQKTTKVFFRTLLRQGRNLFWLYENSDPSLATDASFKPEEIFEVYDDFNQSTGLWLNSQPELCSLVDGSLQIKGANQQDTFIAHQLRGFLPWPSGRMETKIRFFPGQGKRDAGLLFQQETREKPVLFWYLSTAGMTALDRIGPDGLSQTLSWYNWFWSFVPMQWSAITFEWDGPAIKTWVNQKEVMDLVIPGGKGGGKMGVGVRLPPRNKVHFDWFRAYEQDPYLIIETKIGKSEMRTP